MVVPAGSRDSTDFGEGLPLTICFARLLYEDGRMELVEWKRSSVRWYGQGRLVSLAWGRVE